MKRENEDSGKEHGKDSNERGCGVVQKYRKDSCKDHYCFTKVLLIVLYNLSQGDG